MSSSRPTRPRPSRFLVKAALGLLVTGGLLAVGGYVLVRRVLSPDKVRPLAEAKLSAALGKPVKLGEMGIQFLPVPALKAGNIRVGEADRKAPSLAIASLRIVPSLRSVLGGTLAVDRVDLEGLDLALRRDRKGDWQLPYDPPKETAKGGAAEPRGAQVQVRSIRIRNGRFRLVDDLPGPPRETAVIQDIRGELALDAGGFRVESLAARFRKTELAGSARIAPESTTLKLSSPSIADQDLPQILALVGAAPIPGLSVSGKAPFRLEMTIPQKGPLTASGEFDAEVLRLGTMQVTDLKTPFRVEKGAATLSPLTFSAYGGKERGRVTLSFGQDPMGYGIETELEGLDVNQALTANTSAQDVLLGTGRAGATLRGSGFDSGALTSRLSGKAEVAVRNGVVRNLPLLARINQALKITGGDSKDTRFESLDGSFALEAGKAHTEDLKLKAGELVLVAKGDVRFDLTLDFKGSARFSAAKTGRLVHALGELKRLVNDQGELEIPLTVTGPVSSPSVGVDLGAVMGRAVKQELKHQLGRQLQKLFRK